MAQLCWTKGCGIPRGRLMWALGSQAWLSARDVPGFPTLSGLLPGQTVSPGSWLPVPDPSSPHPDLWA